MPEVSVALLPGDGIGPEVVAEAVRVIDAIAPDHGLTIGWHEHLMGGVSIDAHGTALTDEVLEACAGSDAVLLGAVGGPKWDTTDPDKPRPEQGLLGHARRPRPLRQPAPGRVPSRRSTRRARCGASASRAPTCWWCAS